MQPSCHATAWHFPNLDIFSPMIFNKMLFRYRPLIISSNAKAKDNPAVRTSSLAYCVGDKRYIAHIKLILDTAR